MKLEKSLLNFETKLKKLPLQDEKTLCSNSSYIFEYMTTKFQSADDMKKYSPYLFLIGTALEKESRNCAHKYDKLEDKIILTQKMNIK